MGVYSIQASRYSTGMEPLFVKATEQKTRPDFFREVDETIFWELEFPNGLMTKGKSSYNHNWGYLKVKAEKGSFELEPAFSYGGISGRTHQGPMDLPQVNQQALQMDDFAQCILQNKASRIPGEEGLKDMKVIDAIYRSIASGKKERIV
ncbi:Gfo/Idh/MocA family oxidoreductase [Arcticibacter sp. MXS-1]|uniref:Gfo/Idh/MocA family oxidoreductase n=1 Tax=Arcticibacter sp. MXS-1 TaxID=3341726 RepID=UPI0035A858CB